MLTRESGSPAHDPLYAEILDILWRTSWYTSFLRGNKITTTKVIFYGSMTPLKRERILPQRHFISYRHARTLRMSSYHWPRPSMTSKRMLKSIIYQWWRVLCKEVLQAEGVRQSSTLLRSQVTHHSATVGRANVYLWSCQICKTEGPQDSGYVLLPTQRREESGTRREVHGFFTDKVARPAA